MEFSFPSPHFGWTGLEVYSEPHTGENWGSALALPQHGLPPPNFCPVVCSTLKQQKSQTNLTLKMEHAR